MDATAKGPRDIAEGQSQIAETTERIADSLEAISGSLAALVKVHTTIAKHLESIRDSQRDTEMSVSNIANQM